MGAPLNGDWTIYIQDKWAIDNGYVFSWSIAFDPTLVQDCSGPIIQ
jgi:subtilisin-like proprotein convertase family protein